MSSDTLSLGSAEVEALWAFLAARQDQWDPATRELAGRLERFLWGRLTIDQMAALGAPGKAD